MKCAQCQGTNLIDNVRLCENGAGVRVDSYREPEAMIFKGAISASIRARVCADCGDTTLYVSHRDARRLSYGEGLPDYSTAQDTTTAESS